jgi:hypothetical protein
MLWETLPQILQSVTLNGPITINGNGAQVFFVTPSTTLTLSNVTLTGGYTASTFGGGAIYNNMGTVNLNNCTLSGNRASSQGGAIFNQSGVVNITNSTIRDNTADTSGPSPLYEPFFAAGGGLYNLEGTVNVVNSTFSNNNAWAGGGVYTKNGYVSVTNSTFSGNNAVVSVGGNGGAIYVDGGGVSITHGTIAADNAGYAGGIYTNGGWVYAINTILANNSIQNCFGTVYDGGGNLQFNPTVGCVGTSADPRLSGLADNGGLTKTMALQAGSAAINLATANCLPNDQRGFARILSDGKCDAGAYEYGAKGNTTTTLTSSPNPSVYGQSVTFTATVTASAGGAPTGPVVFMEGATLLGVVGLTNGTATFGTSALSFGVHTITANYIGDANYNGSASAGITHVVANPPLFLPLILRNLGR